MKPSHWCFSNSLVGILLWKRNSSAAELSYIDILLDLLFCSENNMIFFCFQHKLVTPYSIKYAGVEWPEKAENLRNKLKKDNITAMVISEMVSTDVKLGLAEHSSLLENLIFWLSLCFYFHLPGYQAAAQGIKLALILRK